MESGCTHRRVRCTDCGDDVVQKELFIASDSGMPRSPKPAARNPRTSAALESMVREVFIAGGTGEFGIHGSSLSCPKSPSRYPKP